MVRLLAGLTLFCLIEIIHATRTPGGTERPMLLTAFQKPHGLFNRGASKKLPGCDLFSSKTHHDWHQGIKKNMELE
jgi:hypothetical protein